ncbi:hypothetical protein AK88_05279 [Plasmodium fragile]|uniref:Uncharacterized protein n=1 Tax=Plasmodium fragile TaxID=5857 RepID=A0A0D9QDL2_PLAFR|nr:uncharacterized protein AK88_05279 [Plasmodium fragile]KJP85088.1 hypothetical protein AK88_05279 [Plasmodium fragile]
MRLTELSSESNRVEVVNLSNVASSVEPAVWFMLEVFGLLHHVLDIGLFVPRNDAYSIGTSQKSAPEEYHQVIMRGSIKARVQKKSDGKRDAANLKYTDGGAT